MATLETISNELISHIFSLLLEPCNEHSLKQRLLSNPSFLVNCLLISKRIHSAIFHLACSHLVLNGSLKVPNSLTVNHSHLSFIRRLPIMNIHDMPFILDTPQVICNMTSLRSFHLITSQAPLDLVPTLMGISCLPRLESITICVS